jgi:hypothetical protein
MFYAVVFRYFAERRRKMRPVRVTNPLFVTADGKPIVNSLNPATVLTKAPPDTRKEMTARLAAKRDAYDILRSLRYLSPLEKERRQKQGIAGTFSIPPPIDVSQPYVPSTDGGEVATWTGPSPISSVGGTRYSSNLPTSRRHRHVTAVQQARAMGAILCDAEDQRPRTAPAQVVTVITSKPLEGSPRIACIPAHGFSATQRARPGTANAAYRSSGAGIGADAINSVRVRPQSSGGAMQRLRLRSPKHMVSGRL